MTLSSNQNQFLPAWAYPKVARQCFCWRHGVESKTAWEQHPTKEELVRNYPDEYIHFHPQIKIHMFFRRVDEARMMLAHRISQMNTLASTCWGEVTFRYWNVSFLGWESWGGSRQKTPCQMSAGQTTAFKHIL